LFLSGDVHKFSCISFSNWRKFSCLSLCSICCCWLVLTHCAGAKVRHSTDIRQTIPYTPYNHSWTVPLAPFLPYPLPFGIRPEFTWLAVGSCFITLHSGSELRATNFGLGLYIKILFRQGWQQSLVLLRLEVFVKTGITKS
jgi:hypothetical protein